MKRLVSSAVAAAALMLLLALPGTAQARTLWVCDVPGEGEVVFVSAADAAFHGISRANERAGATFNRKFGEVCHVEPG
jgi:hypothetical protein